MIQPAPAPNSTGAAGSLLTPSNGVSGQPTQAATAFDNTIAQRSSEAAPTGSGVVPPTPGSNAQPTVFATPVPKGSTVGASQGIAINTGSGAAAPTRVPEIPANIPWSKPKTVSQASTSGGFTARATFIPDGDNVISTTPDGKTINCRLASIDAPETIKPSWVTSGGVRKNASPDQSYGQASKKSLEDLILNKEVTIKVTQVKSGRNYCEVEFQGKDLSMRQVQEGLAMVYQRYVVPGKAAEFRAAEDKAKKQRNGLWRDANPISGEQFRRQFN